MTAAAGVATVTAMTAVVGIGVSMTVGFAGSGGSAGPGVTAAG